MIELGPEIAEWLRSNIPTLVPLDLHEGLAIWRSAGWLIGIAGMTFASMNVPDIFSAVRQRDLREAASGVAFSVSFMAFAIGMAMVDVGWLGVFVAIMFLATRLTRGASAAS